MKLELAVDYWTDFVGTFDPRKVVILVKRAFPETVIDPTDYAAERLARELEYFTNIAEPQRTAIIGQATRRAQDNGPAFRFEIPTNAGPILGHATRYCIWLDGPDDVSGALQEQLVSMLTSLQLGEPKVKTDPRLE